MKKFYKNYIANFQGLTKEIWLLSLVTFINRAGAMVIPFLSLYLINDKNLTMPQVGWIMTFFGVGGFVGTLIGGKLTDILGFHKVITLSLIFGGLGFILLQFVDTFYGLCFAIFGVMLLVDSYRPAIFVACEAYSSPKNVTRSIALIRLAINLGFSIGPLIGGVIIAKINYSSLFWIDGATCIIAGSLLYTWLKPKKVKTIVKEEKTQKEGVSPYRNKLYLFFIVIMVLNATLFVQYFSVVPVYYEKVYVLSEDIIGLLLFINGAMIVVFEMPLVAWLEKIKISKTLATFWGIIFLALSFFVYNIGEGMFILVLAMVLMTLGEMIGSPFSNALALHMAPKGRKGSYMGLYSMSFALSHMIGHNAGMNLVDQVGFDLSWTIFGIVLVMTAILCLLLYQQLLKIYPN